MTLPGAQIPWQIWIVDRRSRVRMDRRWFYTRITGTVGSLERGKTDAFIAIVALDLLEERHVGL